MIYNIQILRAFAALNVVLFHIIGTSEDYGFSVSLLSRLEGWGANGVDIFFVISGFVMLYTQLNFRRSVKDFYLTRLVRIVPIYWLLTSFLVLLYWSLPSVFSRLELTPEWVLSSYLFSSQLFVEKQPVLYQGWTLEWEMLFYLLFGLCLIFRRWATSVALITLSIVVVSVSSGNYIAVEFLFGMAVALLFKNVKIKPTTGLVILCIGAITLSLSVFSPVRVMGLDRTLVWGIPSAILVFGALKSKQVDCKLLNFLGDASYSIYLVQIFTIPAFYKFLTKIGLSVQTDLLAFICLGLTALLGSLTYSFLEKPMTLSLKRKVVG